MSHYLHARMTLFVLFLALISSLGAFAATINVELDIRREATIEEDTSGEEDIAYFVIDCSGSMVGAYDGMLEAWQGKSRLTLLLTLLEERWESLPIGSKVHCYLYPKLSSNRSMEKPYCHERLIDIKNAEQKSKELQKLKEEIKDIVAKRSITPYYHSLAMAFDSIEKGKLLDGRKINLMLYDYTDGLNYTGEHTPKGLRFPTTEETQAAADQAKNSFVREYGGIWEMLKKNGMYEAMWLGPRATMPVGMKALPEYTGILSCDFSNLKNPHSASTQSLPATLVFPMSEENWILLQKCEGTLAFYDRSGEKLLSQKKIALKGGKNMVSLEIPNETEVATIKVICPQGQDGAFKLNSPAPRKFSFPPQERISIYDVHVSPEGAVARDEKVYFGANSNGDFLNWVINGKSRNEKNGSVFSMTFSKAGNVEYSVFASRKGFKDSDKVTGSLKVIATGLTIIPQKSNCTVEKEVELSAEVNKDCVTPSRCLWKVTDPSGDVITLPGEGLSVKHTFIEPGKYQVNLLAFYDELPAGKYSADPVPWKVAEKASIKLDESMVSGKSFDFGEKVTLIAVTKGEVEDIVWYQNGKMIDGGTGKKIQAPAVEADAGRAKCDVEYYAVARDVINDCEIHTETVRFSFGCRHDIPHIVAKDKNGNPVNDFVAGDDVRFVLDPIDQYRDIVWNFGDGNVEETGESGTVKHVYTRGANRDIECTVSCKCGKCGSAIEAVPLSLGIQKIKVVNTFEIVSQKSRYAKKDTITLQATGEGYVSCKFWRKINKDGEWEECENNDDSDSISDNLPDTLCDVYYKMTIVDKEGMEHDDSNQISIGVRSWFITLLIPLIAFGIWLFFWYGWRGNGPKGWDVRQLVFDEKNRDLVLNKFEIRSSKKSLGQFWKAWQFKKLYDKKAVRYMKGNKGPAYNIKINENNKLLLTLEPRSWGRVTSMTTLCASDKSFWELRKADSKKGEGMFVAVYKKDSCMTYFKLLIFMAILLTGAAVYCLKILHAL